jgi:methionyl-tRNA formyltransferase
LAQRALRLGFAGTPKFSVPALEALAGSEHAVMAVFTKPDRPAGRGRHVQTSPVKQRALELGLPVFAPATFNSPETLEALRALALDALVVVAYGLILPPAALAAPRLGCFNIHASLLPRWRGAAPIQRALLAGDARTGVTIMRMEAGLDTGPMLALRAVDVEKGDTGGTLHDRLALLGAALLSETLAALAQGPVPETPQPELGVSYAQKISKAEAEIDWRADVQDVLRKVRAFDPVPVAQTRWDDQQVRIWEAEIAPATAARPDAQAHADGPAHPGMPAGTVIGAAPSGIDVLCGRGVLRVTRLQLAGRKPMTAADVLNSQRLAGASFSSP